MTNIIFTERGGIGMRDAGETTGKGVKGQLRERGESQEREKILRWAEKRQRNETLRNRDETGISAR
jgi:hypothetical protein